MTKKEAWEKWLDRDGDVEVSDIIDMIYDDFESHVCENCKHSIKQSGYVNSYVCIVVLDSRKDYIFLDGDFGCNKWEKKK